MLKWYCLPLLYNAIQSAVFGTAFFQWRKANVVEQTVSTFAKIRTWLLTYAQAIFFENVTEIPLYLTLTE